MFSHLDLLFSTTPLEGPEQMALDEVLLGIVSRPLLRVYDWKSPCVTFGYFQKYELIHSLYPKSSLVRRWSGGGCVEHGEDQTFSLIVPESEPIAKQTPSLFYRRLHEAIVVVLRHLQYEARLATREDQRIAASCFTAPAPCDVMVRQKKVAGGAQRRSRGRLLHQASLQLQHQKWKKEDRNCFFSLLAKQLAPEVNPVEELARIFHIDRDEEAAKPDEARQTSILTQGCMSTYCSSQNRSLTQHSLGFPASAVDRHEISGLEEWLTATDKISRERYRTQEWLRKR